MVAKLYERMPIFMQNLACSIGGWGIRRQRFSKQYYESLAWLEQSDSWPLERLHQYQDEQLRKLVKHCYETVPYYSRQFKELGIKPEDIRTRADLAQIPVLQKDVVRDNPDDFMSSRFRKQDLRKLLSSGTTGAGMTFYRTFETMAFQAAMWTRFRKRFGVVHSLQPNAQCGGRRVVPYNQTKPPFWRKNLGLNQVYYSSFHMSPQNLPHYADHIINSEYVFYTTYASVLSIVAEYMLQHGLRIKKPPCVITTGSESVLPSHRSVIEGAFECPVGDHYGAAEMVCALSQCEHGNYHEDMEFGICERAFVDKHTDGESCRLIGTGLVEYAMPLLRYDMNDIATFIDGDCPCGRQTPIARYFDGRTESYILTPDGRKIGRLARVFADLPNVEESQIEQVAIDELIVRVVPKPSYGPEDEKDYRSKLVGAVGPEFRIRFEETEAIPRNGMGKLRAVISNLKL